MRPHPVTPATSATLAKTSSSCGNIASGAFLSCPRRCSSSCAHRSCPSRAAAATCASGCASRIATCPSRTGAGCSSIAKFLGGGCSAFLNAVFCCCKRRKPPPPRGRSPRSSLKIHPNADVTPIADHPGGQSADRSPRTTPEVLSDNSDHSAQNSPRRDADASSDAEMSPFMRILIVVLVTFGVLTFLVLFVICCSCRTCLRRGPITRDEEQGCCSSRRVVPEYNKRVEDNPAPLTKSNSSPPLMSPPLQQRGGVVVERRPKKAGQQDLPPRGAVAGQQDLPPRGAVAGSGSSSSGSSRIYSCNKVKCLSG